MKARIIRGTYIIREGKSPVLVFWVRGEDGKKHKLFFPSPVMPYFYVRVKDLNRALMHIRRVTKHWKVETPLAVGVDGEKVVKLITYSPRFIGIARRILDREGITSYEGDIRFIRRAMIDLGIYAYFDITENTVKPARDGNVKLRTLYLDIEADDRRGFPNPARDRVISVAAVDDEGNEYFFTCEDNDESEKAMLEQVRNLIEKYDVIVGWNSDDFDRPYLEARWDKFGVKRPEGVVWLDMLRLYRFVGQRELKRYTLDYVASEIEGVGHKVERSEAVGELWVSNPEKLREYNLQDAWLMKKINEEGKHSKGIIDLASAIAEVAGVFIEDITQVSLIVDTIILREARKRKPQIVYKSKTSIDEDKYTGAIVFEPKPGVHRFVAVLDLVSLYNRVIQTFNISHETLAMHEKYDPNRHLRTPTGLIIDKTRRGIIPEILERLEEDRNRFKRERNKYEPGTPQYNYYDMNQWVRKVILLSFYGVLGYRGGRYYTKLLAETITKTGQWVIKQAVEVLQNNGYALIYGDTDSGFFETGTNNLQDAIRVGEEMKDAINKHYWEKLGDMGVPEDWRRIEMKFEKVFSVVVFGRAKKRYAGLLVYNEGLVLEKPKLVIKGLEIVRSDTTELGEEVQHKTVEMVLNHLNDPINHPIDEVYDYLRNVYIQLMSNKLTEKLVRYKGMSKDIDKYKAKQEHVRAAIILRRVFGKVPATRIGYLLIDKDDKRGNVIGAVYEGRVYYYAHNDVVDSKPINEIKITKRALRHYWEREIRAPLERVLGDIINFDTIEVDIGQSILDRFFTNN